MTALNHSLLDPARPSFPSEVRKAAAAWSQSWDKGTSHFRSPKSVVCVQAGTLNSRVSLFRVDGGGGAGKVCNVKFFLEVEIDYVPHHFISSSPIHPAPPALSFMLSSPHLHPPLSFLLLPPVISILPSPPLSSLALPCHPPPLPFWASCPPFPHTLSSPFYSLHSHCRECSSVPVKSSAFIFVIFKTILNTAS